MTDIDESEISEISQETLKRRLIEIESSFSTGEEAAKKPPDEETRRFCDPKRLHDLVYGDAAVAEVQLRTDRVIALNQVHQLVLWVLGDGNYIPWAFVKRKPLIQKCIMVHIPGIDVELWEQHKCGVLSSLHELFEDPITTIAHHPTTTAVQSASMLLKAPVTSKSKQNKNSGHASKRQKKGGGSCSYSELLATPEQLAQYGFPMGSNSAGEADFISTQSSLDLKESVVALDCEMCETAEGSELTRMSLVNETGKVLVDTLVKPKNVITDYRTPFSGITMEMLRDVTTDLKEAQVSKETILVGHSLENDLMALKIKHPTIIDTSINFPHPAGFPRRASLKFLAKRHLGKTIHDGEHDSITDATIALELTKLKKQNGLDFGISERGPSRLEKVMELLTQKNRVCCMVDRPDSIAKNGTPSAHSIPCQTDTDVIKAVTAQVKKDHHFIWAQLQALYRFYINRQGQYDGTSTVGDSQEKKRISNGDNGLEERLKEIGDAVQTIYQSAPGNTMIIVSTGHGDTTEAIQLQTEKARKMAGIDGLTWTEEDEARWAGMSHRVVQGLLFATVKNY